MKDKVKVAIHSQDECGNILTLLQDLVICWNNRTFMVPHEFESDGVSTPRFLWASVSPAVHQETIRAGIAHDWIYRKQPSGWTRKMADDMFYDLCREDGFSWWKSQKAYWGLRMFGGKAWEDNQILKGKAETK